MVLMAGMLPGVECARRRRVRQGAAEAPPCGTRRPSLCLHAGGHDHAHLGSSSASKEIRMSSSCKGTGTLDSTAREAKERLDQKLRSQRESVVKRRQCTSTSREARAASSGSDCINNEHSATTAAVTTTCALQREVLTKNGAAGAGRRRFIWSRLGRRPAAPAVECAVCLEDLREGDVLVHLPCAHRFHWACAVPWVKAASRCPICRAQVHILAEQPDAHQVLNCRYVSPPADSPAHARTRASICAPAPARCTDQSNISTAAEAPSLEPFSPPKSSPPPS